MNKPTEKQNNTPSIDLFKSLPTIEAAEQLRNPTESEIKNAIEKGNEARARAEVSAQPGSVSSTRVFFK